MLISRLSSYFFFFQAEDGIRDGRVTGVQTCALPISEEYREPTEAEWREFEQHFRRRKLALGDCYRPYGTDCPHEHACVRCPMLRMDPDQLPRLLSIEQDTHRLLAEARANGWDGEVLALETTLHHIVEKKAQVQRLQATS